MSQEKEQILNMIDKIRGDEGIEDGDDYVNGPEAAANILKALPLEQREKLLTKIQSTNSNIFSKVASNFFRFQDLVTLTDKSVQLLIQRIDHEDLVLGFRAANRSIQTKFLKNMSKRKMEILLNDIEQLPVASKQDTNSSINRIERLVDSLRTSGQVVSMAG